MNNEEFERLTNDYSKAAEKLRESINSEIHIPSKEWNEYLIVKKECDDLEKKWENAVRLSK